MVTKLHQTMHTVSNVVRFITMFTTACQQDLILSQMTLSSYVLSIKYFLIISST